MCTVVPQVSVILPYGNAVGQISKSLDSILNQVLAEIEILPVSYGSTDGSQKLVLEYAGREERIFPLSVGVDNYGAAVNAGLRAATGQYVAIMNPGDYVMEEFYYILCREAQDGCLDICGVNSYCEVGHGQYPKLFQARWVDSSNAQSFEKINMCLAVGDVDLNLRIYKREYLVGCGIYFDESLSSFQNIDFIPRSISYTDKFKMITGGGYYRSGAPISFSRDNCFDIIYVSRNILSKFVGSGHHPSRYSAIAGYCIYNLMCFYDEVSRRVRGDDSISVLRSEIIKILEEFPEPIVSVKYKKEIEEICKKEINATYIKDSGVSYDSCPEFSIEYFKNENKYHRIVSKISFYSYLSFDTGSIEDADNMRNKILFIILYFPNLRSTPIIDFVKRYYEHSIYNFTEVHNEKWFIAFVLYLIKEVDQSYVSKVYESVNMCRIDTTVVQGFIDLSSLFDYEETSLGDGLRKTKLIHKSIDENSTSFRDYIRGKSIAIVGNASSEIGKGSGGEIDSYDVVIRFNNFSLEEQYNDDYGRRTDVWAVTPGIETLNLRGDLSQFLYIMSPNLGLCLSERRYDLIYDYIISGSRYFSI